MTSIHKDTCKHYEVIAVQIPPEEQVSPLLDGTEPVPENIICDGPYRIHHFTETYFLLKAAFFDRDFINMVVGRSAEVWKKAIETKLHVDGKAYNYEELIIIRRAITDFIKSRISSYFAVCKCLTVMTGKEWSWKCLHGERTVIFPEDDYTSQDLDAFATKLLNTGTQWQLPNSKTVYCVGVTDQEIKAEIAAVAEVSVDYVKLMKFKGWRKIPEYFDAQ